ncbi:MAG: hypothetical protein KAI39_10640 [Desulfobulbaceae bacterium]|nr:hypothetical protein [Desulfobulbaceae bacterium]
MRNIIANIAGEPVLGIGGNIIHQLLQLRDSHSTAHSPQHRKYCPIPGAANNADFGGCRGCGVGESGARGCRKMRVGIKPNWWGIGANESRGSRPEL